MGDMDNTEWLACVEHLTQAAWDRIKGDPALVDQTLVAMRPMMERQIRDHVGDEEWNIDWMPHHGPERDIPDHGPGVTVVLRAWRLKP